MAIHPRQFGIVLKNARMDKKLTQAELAEILDISLPYLKDLERFRNNPSYDVFEKVIRYFNLSADTVIYPNENLTILHISRLSVYLLAVMKGNSVSSLPPQKRCCLRVKCLQIQSNR